MGNELKQSMCNRGVLGLFIIASVCNVSVYGMLGDALPARHEKPVQLRDTVRLPAEHILQGRLMPQFSEILRFQDGDGQSSLIAALMRKERTVLSVANTVCMVLDDYHRWQCEKVSRDSKPMSYRKRSDLIKLILADRPDAIELLDKMQVFKHDEPVCEEMKD